MREWIRGEGNEVQREEMETRSFECPQWQPWKLAREVSGGLLLFFSCRPREVSRCARVKPVKVSGPLTDASRCERTVSAGIVEFEPFSRGGRRMGRRGSKLKLSGWESVDVDP